MGGGHKALLTHSVSASEGVNEITAVIYCLVDASQAVEAIVCPPFVSPYSCSWQYISLDDWQESACVTSGNELHASVEIHPTENPLCWSWSGRVSWFPTNVSK